MCVPLIDLEFAVITLLLVEENVAERRVVQAEWPALIIGDIDNGVQFL
jgi:hypothetical protein